MTSPTSTPHTHTFLDTLRSTPYALIVAGQACPWQPLLRAQAEDSTLATRLSSLLAAADSRTSPIAAQLAAIADGSLTLERLTTTPRPVDPAYSVPGITLAQYGQALALADAGLDLHEHPPVALAGHSQGILGTALLTATTDEERADILALARIIGAATTRAARAAAGTIGTTNGTTPPLGADADATIPTPMLAVSGPDTATLESILAPLDGSARIGLRNARTAHVVSGTIGDLARVERALADAVSADEAERAAKTRGGQPLSVTTAYLDVSAPFHHALLEPAVADVLRWAEACDLDRDTAERFARAILVDTVDWRDEVLSLVDAGAEWVIDLGPGQVVGSLAESTLQGRGITVVHLDDLEAIDRAAASGQHPAVADNWADFAPRLLELPDGTQAAETGFTRLTGNSPVLLAGMTPTTVDPEIVAAAANAGFWAELAGGGQVTADVFSANLADLKEQLEPGRTAKFNAMFMDRYLWNLQFGAQRIVGKARESGAPIDGVVVSAGIPELDEAPELIAELQSQGFRYVAFKPGTVAQIKAGLAIAAAVDTTIILHVEDGHAGGHHSWENLDELLMSTYADIRRHDNVVLCVGGGIGTPERAADYISGEWAFAHDMPLMPVDAVLIGTAAMTAKEARTTEAVKDLLVATEGLPADVDGGWVGKGASAGGMTSGQSHLRADMYEIDNDAAACARLIQEVEGDKARVEARRDEIIAALNRTAKPYFGDLEDMTYAEVVRRFAELSHPWIDPSWSQRFLELLQRVEARLCDADHGTVDTLFASVEDVLDPAPAIERLLAAYPAAEDFTLTTIDAAWFIALCRKYPKPMGFVPVIDDDLLRWWGQDSLWQAQDERYPAHAVRVIPGPVAVAGITTKNEPIATILGRFDEAITARLADSGAERLQVASRLGSAESIEDFLLAAPYISWTGHVMDNPAHILPTEVVDISIDTTPDSEAAAALGEGTIAATLTLNLDTYWDQSDASVHAVRELVVPLLLPPSVRDGGVPVVDESRLPESMFNLLAGTAGVGNHAVTGDDITAMPQMVDSERSPYGEAHYRFTLSSNLGPDHAAVTGAALPDGCAPIVPDAALGPCWPAIYAALGSAQVEDYPVIEGLLNAVHLDHTVNFREPISALPAGATVEVTSWADGVEESSSGRIVQVNLELTVDGERFGSFIERFAIRGRAFGTNLPADPAPAGGTTRTIVDTPRSTLARTRVTAPANMTPFAWVSGDFNPIHTSAAAARVAGLEAPLVHGMWLSATAQHVAANLGYRITGWTYRMFGLVQLSDTVDIQVERIGRLAGGGLVLEVTCRIGGDLVSQATATTAVPQTAYVYPGQGIQTQGMGLDERASSRAVAEVWERADAHTREALGFSILAIVRDNPTVVHAQGTTYRHPDGVLFLTQFTQVALATLAFAQTARLREAGALNDGAYFAGHSLGEYNALSAYAQVIELETVLELVFHRGSTMHNLVPRDEQGRSNYRMGALRPNQFGVGLNGDDEVRAYVAEVADTSGEFLEIVNYNLAGQQYAVAGTVAGIAALEADANARAAAHGGKGAFMLVPGIDVPFHSAVLHSGVDDFRARLTDLVPADIAYEVLLGRYIPNLVARPFELSRDFAESILEVVPAEVVREALDSWDEHTKDEASRAALARLLLIELLSWQFASPVRWIETQALLIGELGTELIVEVGLGAAPTLANLAAKTLGLAEFAHATVAVRNVQRDEKVVYAEDVQQIDALPEPTDTTAAAGSAGGAAGGAAGADAAEGAGSSAAAGGAAPSATTGSDAGSAATLPASASPAAASTGAATPASGQITNAPDLPYKASDAIRTLLALSNKVRADQIGDADTTGTLTNGVSSRLNQLLMDMSAELGLSSVEGAAEADIATLSGTVNKAAFNYSPFGPVLGEAVKDRLRKLFGPSGAKASHIADYVSSEWGLGDGWVAHTTAAILLGSRDGASARGGDLATLPLEAANTAAVNALIDEAVTQVGAAHGIPVAKPQGAGGGGGGVVDSAALSEFSDTLIGDRGILASTARHLLHALGHDTPVAADFDHSAEAETQAVLDAVDAELGSTWPKLVAPAFDTRRAVLIDDRWATAREDIARVGLGELSAEDFDGSVASFRGAGADVAAHARWWAGRSGTSSDAITFLERIAEAAADETPGRYAGQVAVVTGMTPQSIAGGVVTALLAEGATVVATASRISADRLRDVKALYRRHARHGAALWLVPANLASYRDVDALVAWIGAEVTETVGSDLKVIKPALVPDLYFPFAAPPVSGYLADAGPAAENQARLLLWSVERSMTALAELGADTDVDHRLHVVLPGSPNRGTFGGDGAYGETKAAFDAICNKWSVEPWAQRITLAHPRIGWVAGTGLMGGNDPLVDAAKASGVHVWTPEEISSELLDLVSEETRAQARTAPVQADLTGGLGEISLTALREEALQDAAAQAAGAATGGAEGDGDAAGVGKPAATIDALPTPNQPSQPAVEGWGEVSANLEDMIVIVGLGEVSPWGSGRTRFEAEYGIDHRGDVDLSAAGVLELAWMTGLLTWKDSPKAGWYDDADQIVDEADIFDRYRDEVAARCGVRTFVSDLAMSNEDPRGGAAPHSPEAIDVFLDRDVSFTVDSEADAEAYVTADPQFTRAELVEGEWQVTRLAGARARVPRRATVARHVGGQFPTDFDPTRWGIPQDMVESLDRMAVWNLVTTVDAFLSAGFSPAEILQAVHPADVAMTQGTGFGGMSSMRKLFVDRFLGEDIPSDILQETLPNVVAAHTMQSYVGGYGAMIHPVAACATAAVSIEEGIDKIHCHKADFVVAGAIDDISVESITGFANMNATADSEAMAAKGINERFYSRANDRRRGGFVEAQGGGTILLARGSVAAELGLPVYGVVAYARSFADGLHTSIPAPGQGALAAGRGGAESLLASRLAELGVGVDDITVVSKHDTSTNANDPNESRLHTRLAAALGRSEGNPLFVVSQKSLTGHAKGGAAVFQVAGLCDMFRTGRIPANAALDCVDPEMASATHFVWPRRPIQLPQVTAGLLTSLGFGHVSALVALVHPAAFAAALAATSGTDAASAWQQRASQRLRAGVRRRESGMLGHAELFTRPAGAAEKNAEARMLLDPQARQQADGSYL